MATLRVLGCSGGIGDSRHTTSFLLDETVLIDAGSGVLRLSRAELAKIDHVFLTHSHMDHVLALPLLVDSVGEGRAMPLTVHALPEVIALLKAHMFNNAIWPDFSRIPSVDAPFMRFVAQALDETVVLGALRFTALAARHTVPAVGWQVQGAVARWLFSGDSAGHPDFWRVVAGLSAEDVVVIETSFANDQSNLAEISGHYHAAAAAADWRRAASAAHLWISHLKPGSETQILSELSTGLGRSAQALRDDQVFVL
jgi:ribonuclease BN (tRNA processing enzyme)